MRLKARELKKELKKAERKAKKKAEKEAARRVSAKSDAKSRTKPLVTAKAKTKSKAKAELKPDRKRKVLNGVRVSGATSARRRRPKPVAPMVAAEQPIAAAPEASAVFQASNLATPAATISGVDLTFASGLAAHS